MADPVEPDDPTADSSPSDPDFIDPYFAWARNLGPVTSPDQAGSTESVPAPTIAPAHPPGDPYASWASEPVTSPLPSGPMLTPGASAPDQPSLPEGPVTSPAEAPAPDKQLAPFGGFTDRENRAKAIEGMTPEQRAAAVSSMTDDEFVEYNAKRARTNELRRAELEHNAAAESERRARENLEDQRAAGLKADTDTRDLMARADVLARTQIDPDRLVKHLGIGGSVAMLFATTLGGAMSQYTGGRNLALEQFSKRVDADIAAQHADLANQWKSVDLRRNAIAQQYAQHSDLYKAQETYRIAAYNSAIASMQNELQKYDQAGGTAAFVRQNIDQFHAAQQQALQAFQQQQRKNYLDAAKEQREKAAQEETARHNKATEAIDWAKEAREGAKATAEVLTPDQIKQQFPDFPAAAIPQGGATVADLTKRNELYNKALESQNKTTANAMQQAGTQVIGADGNPLTADGTSKGAPVLVAKSEQAEKLNQKIAGGQDLVTSLSKVRRFLASDPSSVSRADWAAATTDFENAKFAYAKLHDTKASSRELEAMESLFGPNFEHYTNRVKDRGTGLARIDTLVNDAQATVASALLREAKYKGPSVIVDTSRPEPVKETAADRGLKLVMSAPPERINSADRFVVPHSHNSVISNDQRATLDGWYSDIKGPDPQTAAQLEQDLQRAADDPLRIKAAQTKKEMDEARTRALENLTAAANNSPAYGVQVYAGHLLSGVVTQSLPSLGGEPERVR